MYMFKKTTLALRYKPGVARKFTNTQLIEAVDTQTQNRII